MAVRGTLSSRYQQAPGALINSLMRLDDKDVAVCRCWYVPLLVGMSQKWPIHRFVTYTSACPGKLHTQTLHRKPLDLSLITTNLSAA